MAVSQEISGRRSEVHDVLVHVGAAGVDRLLSCRDAASHAGGIPRAGGGRAGPGSGGRCGVVVVWRICSQGDGQVDANVEGGCGTGGVSGHAVCGSWAGPGGPAGNGEVAHVECAEKVEGAVRP